MTFSRTYVSVGLCILLSALCAVASLGMMAEAAGGTSITGYAWSDTIGWISLNGTGYGLGIAPGGVVSGYAWSDTIGWVSAEASDVSGCPTSPCTPSISGGAITGWLKALSADGNGWDGWIRIAGSGYGPTIVNGDFSGYSWGSDVVGWVDWSSAHTAYTACTAHYYCSANNQRYEDAYCVDTLVQACSYQCAAGACIAPPLPSFTPSSGGLTGHLQIAPSLVRSGAVTHVFWNVADAASCTVSGGTDSWMGTAAGATGATSSPITAQRTYTLTCTGLDSSTIRESATVNILPVFQEL